MSKPIIESYGTNYYITYLKYDKTADDYFIELPPELQLQLGWEEGDEIEYEIRDQKLYIFKKRDDANE